MSHFCELISGTEKLKTSQVQMKLQEYFSFFSQPILSLLCLLHIDYKRAQILSSEEASGQLLSSVRGSLLFKIDSLYVIYVFVAPKIAAHLDISN